MAVAADERAIETNLTHLKCGHCSELGRQKILLDDAVAVVEDAHYAQLHSVASVVGVRHAADENIKALAGYALLHGLLHLILAEVRQKVCDDKLGILRLTADGDIDDLAVFERHNAVQLERNGHPLVLLDTAVVVGLEVGKLIRLVQGVLL